MAMIDKMKNSKGEGSPIKGRVKRKNTSLWKKILFFFSWHIVPPQHGVVFPPVSHPLFHFYRFTVQPVSIRTSHPSGSRRLCFKRNICTSSTMLKTRPLVHSDPRKSSVPYRVQLILSQILWLLANPLWTHGIGESGSKQRSSAVGGRGSYQSSLVVLYQPHCRFAATPKNAKQIILTHHSLPSNISIF